MIFRQIIYMTAQITYIIYNPLLYDMAISTSADSIFSLILYLAIFFFQLFIFYQITQIEPIQPPYSLKSG